MSVGEFGGIGFAPGVVRGARSFDVDKLGRLTGVTHKQVWRPGENDAECRKADAAMIGAWGGSFTITIPYFDPVTGATSPPKQTVAKANTNAPVAAAPHTLDTCFCGFYAYYDGSNDYHSKGRVSGVVEGYGETLIGTRGFRAMKARIVALRISDSVPDLLASLVARNYRDIPLFESFKAMVAEFPPDGGDNAVTPESDPDFWTRTI